MARVWFSGFETGDFSDLPQFSIDFGSIAIQSSVVRSGNYAITVPGSGGFCDIDGAIPSLTTAYIRIYFYADGFGNGSTIFKIGTSSSSIGVCSLNNDNTVSCFNDNASGEATLGTGTAILSPNTWNMLEIKLVVGAGT